MVQRPASLMTFSLERHQACVSLPGGSRSVLNSAGDAFLKSRLIKWEGRSAKKEKQEPEKRKAPVDSAKDRARKPVRATGDKSP